METKLNHFQEILDMISRGKSIFEKGYFQTLGEIQRLGLIDVDLHKDGTALVRII